jgi:hypothetical protein
MQRTMNHLKYSIYHTFSHSNTLHVVQRVFIYHSHNKLQLQWCPVVTTSVYATPRL